MKKILIILTVLIINLIIANPSYAIKIGLLTEVEQAGVGTNVNGRMIDVNTNKTVCTLDAMKGYILVPYKNEIAVKAGGHFYSLGTSAIVLRPDTEGYVSTKGKWYRGKLMVKMSNGKLVVINDLTLEDILKGLYLQKCRQVGNLRH